MKVGNDFEEMTVAEIVTQNIKTADVFKKNGIDFCCGGNVLMKEVCEKKNVDYEKVKTELLNLDKVSKVHDFDSWELDFLTDYIINTHHTYIVESNPLILQYANKVAKVHGHQCEELFEIKSLFEKLSEELTAHMAKEENILFSYIKQMVVAKRNNLESTPPPFGTIQNPINMMEMEHEGAGEYLKKIAKLANGFTPPDWACNTFRALYSKLEEYQNDLFQHIHLENNILFPKAIKMETGEA